MRSPIPSVPLPSSLGSIGSTLWDEYYNSDETLVALYVPLAFWSAVYLGCKRNWFGRSDVKRDFHEWTMLHNVHNVGAMALGAVSMYCRDDAAFRERNGIFYSLAYFAVDLCDCLARRDVAYAVHAFLCVALGVGNLTSPAYLRLRMNSKATFCELSSPFLHVSRKTRNPVHFAAFALVFTACRVVWIPVLAYQIWSYNRYVLNNRGWEWMTKDLRIYGLFGFYALNLYWYRKILKILYDGVMVVKNERKRIIKQDQKDVQDVQDKQHRKEERQEEAYNQQQSEGSWRHNTNNIFRNRRNADMASEHRARMQHAAQAEQLQQEKRMYTIQC